jgi:iron transport multicopper oxidase
VVRSAGNSTYNFDNPVSRDVVSIGNLGDNVTIRFFTDNYGPWFLHCHIDWHLNASVVPPSFIMIPVLKSALFSGFAVVFAEDIPDVSTQIHPTGKLFTGFSFL